MLPKATNIQSVHPINFVHFFLFLLIVCVLTACSKPDRPSPDATFFSEKITVVDIRTEGEWRETGILEGAITITFFDIDDDYNEKEFIKQLEKVVKKDEEFAIVCRTGRRTRIAAQILRQAGYKVIDLKGGVRHLQGVGIKLVPYRKGQSTGQK